MKKSTRRDFIQKSVLAAGAVGLMSFNLKSSEEYTMPDNIRSVLSTDKYPFELPKLSFAFDALEPYIDAKTMEIHHDKHHQAYIDKLNAALEKYPEHQTKDIKTLFAQMHVLPDDLKLAIRNNGGGHYNHTIFWKMLTPEKNTQAFASDGLIKAINEQYTSMDKFKEAVNDAALSVFGSGWVWAIIDSKKKIQIVTSANQENPIMADAKVKGLPILCMDVWEHAYYLKYQNKRADYLKNIWNVINWRLVSAYFG